MLVGSFTNAERLITKLVKEVNTNRIPLFGINTVIQPLEMVEGGLSEVEERIFLELAATSGAKRAWLHIGPALSDADVLKKIHS